MLSAITLGLRTLQMILAIALFGLSVSLIHESCKEFGGIDTCFSALGTAFDKNHAPRTARYSVFLGICGMLVSAIGTVALFVDRIPTIVPLVGDCLGALFFLAGGIAWVVRIGARRLSCSELKNTSLKEDLVNHLYAANPNLDKAFVQDVANWLLDASASACKQGEAAHGLVWALFAFTAGLAICDYFRRRDQAKSLK